MNNAAEFSAREHEVIALLLQGKSDRQIAAELKISTRTVEFHLTDIYQKLGVASRAEAIGLLRMIDLETKSETQSPPDSSLPQRLENRLHRLSVGIEAKKRILVFSGSLFCFGVLVYLILVMLFRSVPVNAMKFSEPTTAPRQTETSR
jgi:DNA-binding CsgD family transcriptional regulator